MADVLKKVPVREQDPKVRATNFEEVCYGYNQEEAMEEASRCINCKNAKCIQGCPVGINIPAFVHEVKEGNIEEAYKIIGQSSALPAVCGRVCPQESQCEGKCIRGIKGESISIGKLERFVADYALEHDIKPVGADKKNGHKVAVIGSGPAGLTCAGDLAKLGYDVTVFEARHELDVYKRQIIIRFTVMSYQLQRRSRQSAKRFTEQRVLYMNLLQRNSLHELNQWALASSRYVWQRTSILCPMMRSFLDVRRTLISISVKSM